MSRRQVNMEQLSEPMLARARERLGTVALLLGVVLNIMALSATAWFLWGGLDSVLQHSQDVDLLTANLWLLLAGVSRIRALSHVTVLRLGQATVVFSCLTVAFFHGLNLISVGHPAPTMTWAPILIATYPLLIPSPPRVTLGVVVLAAVAAPLGIFLGGAVHGTFSGVDVIASAIAPAVAALIAVVGSDLVYRSTIDIAELRDQEALLQTVVDGVDEVIVVRDAQGQVVFANDKPALTNDVATATDGLFVSQAEGRAETWLVAHSSVYLRGLEHTLTVARRLTATLDQAEVESWKRLIRALSHELNNSLAPMSSLLHSVGLMIGRPEHRERLEQAVKSLSGRVRHLSAFLEEYSGFARLPRPRQSLAHWDEFVAGLAPLAQFEVVEPLPTDPGWFDRGQLEQVMLNLLKNAAEAGGEEIPRLSVTERDGGFAMTIADRGTGLSEEAAERALLPFYSTKEGGTGLGLALSRDIVVAHKGWLTLTAREGGGAEVRLWLPPPPAP